MEYWKKLEIPVEDFLDEMGVDEKAFARKIFNRLRKRSTKWLEFLGLDKTKKRERFRKFLEIYQKNKESVFSMYCCSWFASKIGHIGLIREYAAKFLESDEMENYRDDADMLIILLHFKHKDALTDLIYDFFIRKCKFNRYIPDPRPQVERIELDKETVENLLNTYERRRKKRRQESKVWWFKETENEWIIVFRRSRLKSAPIKLVDRNEFVRLADLKVFKIRKDLSVVEIYTKKEEKTMVKFVENLIKDLTHTDIKLLKEERKFPEEKMNALISRWMRGQDADVKLLEAGFMNFPLADSPKVIIKTQDEELGIENALTDLRETYGLVLDESDYEYVRVRFRGRKFTMKFFREGKDVSITFDYRGLSLEDREEILKHLDRVLAE
ncbi:hypothetical protein [Archaeoglobus sp.]